MGRKYFNAQGILYCEVYTVLFGQSAMFFIHFGLKLEFDMK